MNHRCCNLLFYTQTGNTNTFTMPDIRVVHYCGHLGVNFIQIHTGGSIEMTRLCALSFSPNPPGLSFFFFFFFPFTSLPHTGGARLYFTFHAFLISSSPPYFLLSRQRSASSVWADHMTLCSWSCE